MALGRVGNALMTFCPTLGCTSVPSYCIPVSSLSKPPDRASFHNHEKEHDPEIMVANQHFQANFGALTDELVEALTQISPEVSMPSKSRRLKKLTRRTGQR
jgi:hypothetical protein